MQNHDSSQHRQHISSNQDRVSKLEGSCRSENVAETSNSIDLSKTVSTATARPTRSISGPWTEKHWHSSLPPKPAVRVDDGGNKSISPRTGQVESTGELMHSMQSDRPTSSEQPLEQKSRGRKQLGERRYQQDHGQDSQKLPIPTRLSLPLPHVFPSTKKLRTLGQRSELGPMPGTESYTHTNGQFTNADPSIMQYHSPSSTFSQPLSLSDRSPALPHHFSSARAPPFLLPAHPSYLKTPLAAHQSHSAMLSSVDDGPYTRGPLKMPPKHYAKPITCYYWYNGGCWKIPEHCAFAHYNTGTIAEAPGGSKGGERSVDGRGYGTGGGENSV